MLKQRDSVDQKLEPNSEIDAAPPFDCFVCVHLSACAQSRATTSRAASSEESWPISSRRLKGWSTRTLTADANQERCADSMSAAPRHDASSAAAVAGPSTTRPTEDGAILSPSSSTGFAPASTSSAVPLPPSASNAASTTASSSGGLPAGLSSANTLGAALPISSEVAENPSSATSTDAAGGMRQEASIGLSEKAPGSNAAVIGASQARTGASAGPRSTYYFGPPPSTSAFGTAPVGVIGRDKPREIIRIERDYTAGESCQFHPSFPLELDGRITPTIFSETINDINVILIAANDAGWACFDNALAVLSLYITPLLIGSKYKRVSLTRFERSLGAILTPPTIPF